MPKTKIRTSGIDHVVLYVSDVARSKRFYLDVLGMKVAHASPRHTFLRCGSQLIGLFEAPDKTKFEAGHDLNHLAFQVDSGTYEGITGSLKGQGITVTGRRGDDRCVYFDDPDGHRLQIVVPGEY